jgi:hypothetical protein
VSCITETNIVLALCDQIIEQKRLHRGFDKKCNTILKRIYENIYINIVSLFIFQGFEFQSSHPSAIDVHAKSRYLQQIRTSKGQKLVSCKTDTGCFLLCSTHKYSYAKKVKFCVYSLAIRIVTLNLSIDT